MQAFVDVGATFTTDHFLETTHPTVEILSAVGKMEFEFDNDLFKRQANALVASMMEATRISQDLSKLEFEGMKASDFNPELDMYQNVAVLALGA